MNNQEPNIPSVSIITVTQSSRFESFKILFEMVQLQTYQNIQEWTIVEGSPTLEQSNENTDLIMDLFETYLQNNKQSNICIKILPFTTYKPLGELRNLGNSECTGDIIVCMDDDDYYPPSRISHAVESLMQYTDTDFSIAGSSVLYIYDFFLDKLYKYDCHGVFGPYHSTNNCMAFKREYLKTNKHDDTAINAEERSFTKNFTNKMVELSPLETIVCISHSSNTFNKRNLCIGGSLGIYQYMKEINEPIADYIPQDIYNMMKIAYYKNVSDGPFTIEHLLKINDKNVHFLEKHKNEDFELKCKIRNMIQNE